MNVPNKQVMRRAYEIYAAQSIAPLSPGDMDEAGNVSFCAAAAIAVAGIEMIEGAEARRTFEKSIIESGSTDEVFAAFDRFEWDDQLCAITLERNDAASSCSRRSAVLNLLSEAMQ